MVKNNIRNSKIIRTREENHYLSSSYSLLPSRSRWWVPIPSLLDTVSNEDCKNNICLYTHAFYFGLWVSANAFFIDFAIEQHESTGIWCGVDRGIFPLAACSKAFSFLLQFYPWIMPSFHRFAFPEKTVELYLPRPVNDRKAALRTLKTHAGRLDRKSVV